MMSIIVLMTLFAVSRSAVVPSLENCDERNTCSPLQCVTNTEADCPTPAKAPFDFAKEIASATCQQCTQSTTARCVTLSATIRKQSGVAAAYCTDRFLVIWATGLPDYNVSDSLAKIPLPPGGDGQCRVRTGIAQPNVYKVPIEGVPPPASGSNKLPQALVGVEGMPEAGAVAVAVDGVAMFPNYNNRGLPAWDSCELDACNAHSGRGYDYHYHGDPFGEKCLYQVGDVSETEHPPLIAWALDGYNVHGRHTHSAQPGIEVDLDECGGHEHGDHGYHYHSTVDNNTIAVNGLDGTGGDTRGVVYTAFRMAPTTCWHGDVGSIEQFWDGKQASYDRSKSDIEKSRDYDLLRPCCGSTSFVVADGIALDGAAKCSSGLDCSLGAMSTANDFGGKVVEGGEEGDGESSQTPAVSQTPAEGDGESSQTPAVGSATSIALSRLLLFTLAFQY